MTLLAEAAVAALLLLLNKAPRWVIATGERLGVITYTRVGDIENWPENWPPDDPLWRAKRKSA